MSPFLHRLSATLTAIAAAALITLPAHASPRALTDWQGAQLVTSNTDQLWGWRFGLNSAINVTSLGVYDQNADGLSMAHGVAIFRLSDNALMASAQVGSGKAGTLDTGNFRYTSLDDSVALVAGEIYTIVMQEFGSVYGIDPQYFNAKQVFTADAVQYLGADVALGSGLDVPEGGFTHVPGGSFIGPNFQFDTDSSRVPEPGTFALVLAALAVLGCTVARRPAA